MSNKLKMLCAIIVLSLPFLFSCADRKETGNINKKNYLHQLENLREHGISDLSLLKDLDQYIDMNKDQIYGNKEEQYNFDKGIIYFFLGKFLTSFNYFKHYIDVTQDKVLPYFIIGKFLNQQNSNTFHKVFTLAAFEAKGDCSIFTPNQQFELFLGLEEDLFLYFNMSDLSEKLQKSDRYTLFKEIFLKVKNECKSYNSEYIERLWKCEYFDPVVIKDIENKPTLKKEEIDFLIIYYSKPLTHNVKKALYWMKKRGKPLQWSGDESRGYSVTAYIMENMMSNYLLGNQYDDVIRLYDEAAESLPESKKSQHHIYLYVSAAYAGKNIPEKALVFLKKEIENTKVHMNSDKSKSMADLSNDGKGDTLYSIFSLVFLLKEFEILEKQGQYNKIEELLEN